MWDISQVVGRWRAEGRRAVVARVVSFSGLGGRRAGEALALADDGSRAGGLLGGSADAAVAAVAGDLLGDGAGAPAGEGAGAGGGAAAPAVIVEVGLGDPEAIAAGLACGGVARVLVQDVAGVPSTFWDHLIDRRPVELATPLAAGAAPVVIAGDGASGEVGPAVRQEAVVEAARRLLAGGREANTMVEDEAGDVLVEAFVPATRIVVLSDPAGLADAIARQATLLGWEPLVLAGQREALEAVGGLGPADAVVVLTHDHDLATPVLAAALARRAYAGALGSRHTQQVRQEHLEAAGVGEAERARVHGPVGLDLGARAPEETALAVCAEILAARSGRDARSLAAGAGPING